MTTIVSMAQRRMPHGLADMIIGMAAACGRCCRAFVRERASHRRRACTPISIRSHCIDDMLQSATLPTRFRMMEAFPDGSCPPSYRLTARTIGPSRVASKRHRGAEGHRRGHREELVEVAADEKARRRRQHLTAPGL